MHVMGRPILSRYDLCMWEEACRNLLDVLLDILSSDILVSHFALRMNSEAARSLFGLPLFLLLTFNLLIFLAKFHGVLNYWFGVL